MASAKKIYLDTNILVDFILQRPPNAEFATAIIRFTEMGLVESHCSALAFSHVHYVAKKKLGNSPAINALRKLSQLIILNDVTANKIQDALYSSFNDFEDALQYECAQSVTNLHAIITNNPKDFKRSAILVLTAEQFVKGFEE